MKRHERYTSQSLQILFFRSSKTDLTASTVDIDRIYVILFIEDREKTQNVKLITVINNNNKKMKTYGEDRSARKKGVLDEKIENLILKIINKKEKEL